MPKISVIIPTYNRAELLSSALVSVLNQTFQDFEIIVVDDNSRDNTPEVVTGFNESRIKYIRHEMNKRVAAARNTGVINSNGQYIAFLDDDDEWLPDKLKMQFNLLEKASSITGVTYSGSFIVERSSGKILAKLIPTKRGNIFDAMIDKNWICTSTVFLRRECFEKVGLFDINLGFAEDYDMWLRISKEYHIDYVEEPLVKYNIAENGRLSTDNTLMIAGIETLLNKHDQLFASHRKSYSLRYLSLGALYCCNGNTKKGREAFSKAIGSYPFEIKHYFYFCLSLLGPEHFKRYKEAKEKLTTP